MLFVANSKIILQSVSDRAHDNAVAIGMTQSLSNPKADFVHLADLRKIQSILALRCELPLAASPGTRQN